MLAVGSPEGGYRPNLDNILVCPDCQEVPPNLIEEFSSGDMVCSSCGLVVGEKIIDTRSEWRTFANDDKANDDPSRVGDGGNELIGMETLATEIKEVDGVNRKLAKLQRNNHQDKTTKALLQAYKEIGQYCDSINTGKAVSESAKHIYKLVDSHKLLKTKSQEALIAGCIFVACRQHKAPRTFHEIYNLTKVSKKEIGRVFKQLETFLQKLNKESTVAGSINSVDAYDNSSVTSAEDLCARFCSQLAFRLAQKIENLSRDLAKNSTHLSELSGRSPLSVAAACIYMASHLFEEPRALKEISQVAGVSDSTVKTAYKFLYHSRDRMISPEWRDNKSIKLAKLPTN